MLFRMMAVGAGSRWNHGSGVSGQDRRAEQRAGDGDGDSGYGPPAVADGQHGNNRPASHVTSLLITFSVIVFSNNINIHETSATWLLLHTCSPRCNTNDVLHVETLV